MKKILVLGTGCKKCHELMNNVQIAVKDLGIEADVQKVNDIVDIMNYGVMLTPAVIIDDKIISSGKLLTVDNLKEILSD